MDVTLWVAIGANLLACAASCWTSLRNIRRYRREIRAFEEFTASAQKCATLGHDFKYDVLTLENHQPPEFEWTHIHKWTCSRCDFEERVSQRQAIYCPGVSEIKTKWLGREDC